MISTIQRLRKLGYRVGALTNNWYMNEKKEIGAERDIFKLFDFIVESRVVGYRKPDLRIYQHLQKVVNVPYEEIIFLDDLGPNLKAAASLGIKTIKVDLDKPNESTNTKKAISQLESLLQISLLPLTSKL
jgi:epoxide hydrolase-like predicted phosphatase